MSPYNERRMQAQKAVICVQDPSKQSAHDSFLYRLFARVQLHIELL